MAARVAVFSSTMGRVHGMAGGAGGRFWNALPSEMRPGPGPGFLGSWNLSSVQDPKQMRPIVPPRDDALKTKEYPDSA